MLGLGGFVGARWEMPRLSSWRPARVLAPTVLSMLSGHSVAMEPTQASLAFAYPRLDWDPEPVLQGYTAYTSYLDR